ncbi:hypothetical protein Hanom_Chr01g00009301 [Helianthus anomalus]
MNNTILHNTKLPKTQPLPSWTKNSHLNQSKSLNPPHYQYPIKKPALTCSSSCRNPWCHILGGSVHNHSAVHTLPLISFTTTVGWCSTTPTTSVAAVIIPSTAKFAATIVPSSTTVVSAASRTFIPEPTSTPSGGKPSTTGSC